MNPLFFQMYRAEQPSPPIAPSAPPVVENPATVYDRAYIAAQAELIGLDLFAYDRPPVEGEWPDVAPSDAIVRVFVINEWTTVRVLQDSSGQRISEPAMDSWRGELPSFEIA